MKNPNGFGTVYKLSGRRRKPWAVRVTDSWEIVGTTLKRKYKYIGYYETRKEAMQALAEYNVNPAAVSKDITFVELYKMWSEEKFDCFSKSTVTAYRAAFKTCAPLYGYNFKELRRPQLQKMIDESGKAYQSLAHIKALLTNMYSFAIENDICSKDYAQYIDLTKHSKKDKEGKTEKHKVFTEDEITALWDNIDNRSSKAALMMIYTGVRISELLNLRKSDVHLNEQWFHIGKSKTAAGVRDVPIADKVLPFFAEQMQTNGEYLFHNKNRKYSYDCFLSNYWNGLSSTLDTEHLPHDTRHTCVSRLAEKRVDQTIIKKIVGHTGAMSVTEKVYTHYDIKPLLEAVNLI